MTAARHGWHGASRGREIVTFLGVGAVAFVVQIGLLNLLVSSHVAALPANAIAIVTSVIVAYVGNRQLSFAHRRRAEVHREATAFVLVNAVTLGLSEALLAIAYLAHVEHDRLAINLLDLAGIAVGTLVRYSAYRRFVFTAGELTHGSQPQAPVTPAVTSGPVR